MSKEDKNNLDNKEENYDIDSSIENEIKTK